MATRYVQNRFVSEVHRLLHDRQVETVQRLIDGRQPTRILEIAPGPGRITRAVRTDGRLVCLEFNEGMIQQGRPQCDPQTQWVRGNGFQLPFDQAFELVYSFRFVRHFHRADRDRLYGEIHRVLQPGGLFVMDAVNERISRPLREAHPEEYPVYDKLYRREELAGELAAAGFVVQGLEPVQKFAGLQSLSQNLIGPRINLVNRWFVRLLERFPRRDGLEWIVICRRA
jgi:ubiquinone/menaquinone biosynthesis C-methylase UbiE